MNLKPDRRFEKLVSLIDFFNPYIVIASIAGLVLEYTAFKEYVTEINKVIDLLFLLDFGIRIISFPSRKYFFKAYGWVDFLACIPGLTAFMQFGQYFGLFKVMRIGRFFKIIRVLRFLRIFSFLKKMKGDSVFIQERVMKIGVTIVLVFVAGLAVVDIILTDSLIANRTAYYETVYDLSRNRVRMTAERDPRIIYYTDNSVMFDRDGKESTDYTGYREKLESNGWFIEVNLTRQVFSIGGSSLPVEGVLADGTDIMRQHDKIMLVLVLTLISILVLIIFYIGYIFAKDMRIVQLINDSFDAEDYMLLREEAGRVNREAFDEQDQHDEITELLLKSAEAAEKLEKSESVSLSGFGFPEGFGENFTGDFTGGPAGTGKESLSGDPEKILDMLENIEKMIRDIRLEKESELRIIADEAAVKAVRLTSRSIGEYILKVLGKRPL